MAVEVVDITLHDCGVPHVSHFLSERTLILARVQTKAQQDCRLLWELSVGHEVCYKQTVAMETVSDWASKLANCLLQEL